MSIKAYPIFPLILCGCVISPVPLNIHEKHKETQKVIHILEEVLQEGDIIFRLSNAKVLNGIVNFSRMVADLSESDFSHALIVYKVTDEGVIVANVDVLGIERKFLQDWYIDGTKNVVVKRLKPSLRIYLPKVMKELRRLVQQDVLYDDKFIYGDEKYYCTELVDHCFRKAGLPLANYVRIKDLPAFNFFHVFAGFVARIDMENKIVIAGNDEIGLFSSPFLETILDLRGVKP